MEETDINTGGKKGVWRARGDKQPGGEVMGMEGLGREGVLGGNLSKLVPSIYSYHFNLHFSRLLVN